LETAAEIHKCLRVVIDFVNGAQLWIEAIKILQVGLVFRAAKEIISEIALCENQLRPGENRQLLRDIKLVLEISRNID